MMKKRTMALFLVIAMLLSTSALAAGLGESEAEVTATYVEGNDESPIVYSVDITWDELDFTYYEASAPVWDPVNHVYISAGQPEGWAENDTADFQIENHSNTEVLATFSYTPETGYESTEMTFDATQLVMQSAEKSWNETTVTNTVTPSGTLPEGTKNDVIGYITVQIAPCADVDPQMVSDWAAGNATACSDFITNNDNYDILCVESADEVPSGKQYILKSEIERIKDDFYALTTAADIAKNDPSEQEMLNWYYYRVKAKAEIFENTQIYTKS